MIELVSELVGGTTNPCLMELASDQEEPFVLQLWREGSSEPVFTFPGENHSDCPDVSEMYWRMREKGIERWEDERELRCRIDVFDPDETNHITSADMWIENIRKEDEGRYKCRVEFLRKRDQKKVFVSCTSKRQSLFKFDG